MTKRTTKESKQKEQPGWTGRITDLDIHLFKEGNHFKLYEKLGCHQATQNGIRGASFSVWAPNAKDVSVVGDFNGWDRKAHLMNARWDGSGIWELFVPNVPQGSPYKYFVQSHHR